MVLHLKCFCVWVIESCTEDELCYSFDSFNSFYWKKEHLKGFGEFSFFV